MERAHCITIVVGTLAAFAACGPHPAGELAAGEIGQTSAALLAPDPCIKAAMFTHIANEGNISGPNGYSTAIDHPTLNDKPAAKLIVTPNWTPNGGDEVRDYHPIGVWYNAAIKRWSVYHADATAMPVGTGFNVRVGSGSAVRSPASGTPYLGFPVSSLPASAKLFATPTYNPAGLPVGNNNWSPLFMFRSGGWWYLAHTDYLPFDAGTNYFLAEERCATVHTTAAGNVVGADYVLDAALANGNKNAIVIAMHQATIWPGAPGHLAVRYDGPQGRWLVRGWRNSAEEMPVGRTMSVAVQTPAP